MRYQFSAGLSIFTLLASGADLVVKYCTVVQVTTSPSTLTDVRHMSNIRSTPKISAIPAAGIPTPSSTMLKMIIPAPGVAGEPIDAATDIVTMNT